MKFDLKNLTTKKPQEVVAAVEQMIRLKPSISRQPVSSDAYDKFLADAKKYAQKHKIKDEYDALYVTTSIGQVELYRL